jgi:hypothetical protein
MSSVAALALAFAPAVVGHGLSPDIATPPMEVITVAAPFAVTVDRRDPFAPFDASTVDVVVGGERRCSESRAACAALDDIVVKAIVSGTASPRVMVELKDGTGVVLRTGDMLGKGRIKSIRRDAVVVERFYFSAASGTIKDLTTLPLGQ